MLFSAISVSYIVPLFFNFNFLLYFYVLVCLKHTHNPIRTISISTPTLLNYMTVVRSPLFSDRERISKLPNHTVFFWLERVLYGVILGVTESVSILTKYFLQIQYGYSFCLSFVLIICFYLSFFFFVSKKFLKQFSQLV